MELKVESMNVELPQKRNIGGNRINVEIYKCLDRLSNSVGQTINEYHWRELCGLMKKMEDEKFIIIRSI